MDATSLGVFRHRMEAIAEEMGVTLQRSASAPNIKERRDYSCAIFNPRGQLVAQGAHMPVHLGSMAASVAAVLSELSLDPGSIAAVNDPYNGGTHLPDVTLVAAVFRDSGERLAYVATRAHHVDIGGMSPGSMPLATEIFQEGQIIPPLLIKEQSGWDEKLLRLLLRNVRAPSIFRADLMAQAASLATGERRLLEVDSRQLSGFMFGAMDALMTYSERATRAAISAIPDGAYVAEDRLDDMWPGGDPVTIRVRVTVSGDALRVDFTGSDSQQPGPLNAVEAVTRSAVYYCVRALLLDDVPMNDGCFRPVDVYAPIGSVTNATYPAAVSGGNVETSQRLVDTVLRALAKALPAVIPAAGQGTMNNVTFGGWDAARARPFVWYETLGGGMGGGPVRDGLSAVHVAMSNTRNTPIESMEMELPVRIVSYSIRRGTGGTGMSKGGDGLERVYEFLEKADGTVISERRRFAPWGLAGGGPGECGQNLIRRQDGEVLDLGSKARFSVAPGDWLVIRTPGGGGWGAPGPKLPTGSATLPPPS